MTNSSHWRVVEPGIKRIQSSFTNSTKSLSAERGGISLVGLAGGRNNQLGHHEGQGFIQRVSAGLLEELQVQRSTCSDRFCKVIFASHTLPKDVYDLT